MNPRYEYETWLDVACPVEGTDSIVCSLFSRVSVEIPFHEGERVTFWPRRQPPLEFHIRDQILGMERKVHYVGSTVHDISRNFHPTGQGPSCTFCLHYEEVRAISEQDARLLVQFLIEEHGFEVDPYGPKHLFSDGAV